MQKLPTEAQFSQVAVLVTLPIDFISSDGHSDSVGVRPNLV